MRVLRFEGFESDFEGIGGDGRWNRRRMGFRSGETKEQTLRGSNEVWNGFRNEMRCLKRVLGGVYDSCPDRFDRSKVFG